MNKFYTDIIPEQIYFALCQKGFEYDESNPGFGINCPTYADALDWLLDNGCEISISKLNEDRNWSCQVIPWRGSAYIDDFKEVFEENFNNALDQAILLALEFIKSEKDDNA